MKNLVVQTFTLFLILIFSDQSNAERTAKIESCSGWSLNRLPKLKEFLKGDAGAITYHNVEIEFIRGRKATMTIMDDSVEVETVVLSDYEEIEDMHALFVEKGFQKMTEEELRDVLEEREKEELREEEEQAKRRDDMKIERDQIVENRRKVKEERQRHSEEQRLKRKVEAEL